MAAERKAAGRQAAERDKEAAEGPPAGDTEPDDAGSKRLEKDIAELLADTERERDEYLDLAQRTKADFENYRRRITKEVQQAQSRGRAELARSLLGVVDDLERALAAAEPRGSDAAPGHLAEGVRLVYESLAGVLRNAGLESYEPAGEPFDPDLHEAMMTRPVEPDDAGRVVEVLEKGYRLDGQVLRPARVVVGEQPSGEANR